MINNHNEIVTVPPRRPSPVTQPIVAPAPAPRVETGSLNVGGWAIQVVGDAVFITCDGEVMTQTRTGKLNQKEIVVRRDPLLPSNARDTDLLGKNGG